MKKLITLMLLGVTILSCSLIEKKAEKDKEEKVKNNMDLVINTFTKKYNIIYQWDTLRYGYSIDYKSVIESKYQLIKHFDVLDIYEKNEILFVSIKTGIYKNFYFDFPITKEQERILKKNRYNWANDKFLVVSIPELKKIRLTLEAETYVGEDVQSWINFEPPFDDFFGKGQIIEIVQIEVN